MMDFYIWCLGKNGDLLYMGVIVDISKAQVNGIAGTGESAAPVLSANGLAIKVSSNGLIQIFDEGNSQPYISDTFPLYK